MPAADEYFVRITGGDDTIQLYELVLSISSPVIFLAADFDMDGDVDGADLATWQAAFGLSAAGDTDDDTDGHDFLTWQRQFTGDLGAVSSPTTAVPEPATTLLLLTGMLKLAFPRGKRSKPLARPM